jgi:hypothetical protein
MLKLPTNNKIQTKIKNTVKVLQENNLLPVSLECNVTSQ